MSANDNDALLNALGPASYEVLRMAHPGLCRNVKELLAAGQTPRQIADYTEHVGNAELAGLVELAARYLLGRNHPPAQLDLKPLPLME